MLIASEKNEKIANRIWIFTRSFTLIASAEKERNPTLIAFELLEERNPTIIAAGQQKKQPYANTRFCMQQMHCVIQALKRFAIDIFTFSF